MVYRTKGIIINRQDVGEADKILTIFTEEEGKIKVYAKGIRRVLSKNSGHVELFTYSDLTLVKSRALIDKLATAETIQSFKNLRKDLKKTALVYFFSEIVDKLTMERDKNPFIFNLLLESLQFLDQQVVKTKFNILSSYFIFNFLAKIGYQPILSRDFFLAKIGKARISNETLKLIKAFLTLPLEVAVKIKIPKETEDEIKELAKRYLTYIAEREFKADKFLKELNVKLGRS